MSTSEVTTTITVNPAYAAALGDFVARLGSEGLPVDADIIYEGRNRVARVKSCGHDLCIKAFRVPGPVKGRIYGSLRESKALRSYSTAMKLLEMGFATPAPVAAVERKRGGRLLESYYVCEYIDAKPIYHYECGPEFKHLSKKLAADLASMHRRGVFMPDFTPGNLLVTDALDPEKSRIHYVDLNRTLFNITSRRVLRRTLNSPFYMDIHVEAFLRDYAEASGMALSTVTSDFLKARHRYNRLKRLAHPIKYFRKNAR